MRRTLALLTARTAAVPSQAVQKENVRYRHMRAVALVCAGESLFRIVLRCRKTMNIKRQWS
jgi:hypothetical protein